MFPILKKERLSPEIYLLVVQAPRVARAVQPGQFVIVRLGELGERIPLTVCDYHAKEGTITLVVQAVGASSRKICALQEGEAFTSFVGPLGLPSEFVHLNREELQGKRFLFVAGGLGVAPVYPQVKYLYERGAHVEVIAGYKTHSMVIMEDALRAVCHNLYVATDDGSYGAKGLVTQLIEERLAAGAVYDQAVAIGSMIMMKFVTLCLKPSGIPLIVSLNTLMVDGTGMCGACRVTVGGKTRFACVEGPEFNAYEVDFEEALRRQLQYRTQELEAHHACKIDLHQNDLPQIDSRHHE